MEVLEPASPDMLENRVLPACFQQAKHRQVSQILLSSLLSTIACAWERKREAQEDLQSPQHEASVQPSRRSRCDVGLQALSDEVWNINF